MATNFSSDSTDPKALAGKLAQMQTNAGTVHPPAAAAPTQQPQSSRPAPPPIINEPTQASEPEAPSSEANTTAPREPVTSADPGRPSPGRVSIPAAARQAPPPPRPVAPAPSAPPRTDDGEGGNDSQGGGQSVPALPRLVDPPAMHQSSAGPASSGQGTNMMSGRPPQDLLGGETEVIPAIPADAGPDTPPPGISEEEWKHIQSLRRGGGQQRASMPVQQQPPAAEERPQQNMFASEPGRPQDRINPDSYKKVKPTWGWRAWLAKMGIVLEKSTAEQQHDRRLTTMNSVIRSGKNVVFVRAGGGSGASTSAIIIGSIIAKERKASRTALVDADSGAGIDGRIHGVRNSSLKRFAQATVTTNPDVLNHATMSPEGLAAYPAEPVTTKGYAALTANEFDEAVRRLKITAGTGLVLVDTEKNLGSPVNAHIIASADVLVLVTTADADSANAARDFVAWIRNNRLDHLLARTLVLLNQPKRGKSATAPEQTVTWFSSTEPAKMPVLAVPFDEHLAEAGEIHLDLLSKSTYTQFEKAAAMIVEKTPK